MDCHENSYEFSRNDANAFTLAEVLITLVIVGVIAAVTVPTLITKYQKEQTVTRLKQVGRVVKHDKSWTFSRSVHFNAENI